MINESNKAHGNTENEIPVEGRDQGDIIESENKENPNVPIKNEKKENEND